MSTPQGEIRALLTSLEQAPRQLAADEVVEILRKTGTVLEDIERVRAEESKLLEITTALSRELVLSRLLQRIMAAVTEILDADRSTLFMHDRKTDELWSEVAQGMGLAQIRFAAHLGIAGSVFKSGLTVNIPDCYQDSRFNPEVDRKTGYRTESMLCMPMVTKQGATIGVVQVLNKRGGPFTSHDETRLGAFSSQASIAIENAQLFEDVLAMKNYNESILESMSNGVITLDDRDTLVTANRAALRLFGLEGREGELQGHNAEAFFGARNAWVAEAIGRVRRTGKPDVAMDADVWVGQIPSGEKPITARRSDRASVNLSVVPLKSGKGADIGSLLVLEDITTEKRLKGTMARYMPKEVADKLLEEGEGVLGGQMQTATVLFTDIRSFTSITERLGAHATVQLLNEYFTLMVDVILEHGGILDKYIGDAIMAVFGAPFSGPRDADHAVQAGIGMLKVLREFNERRAAAGQDALAIGIGINTDGVLSGNIGSPKRMDYTVIGDGVNLASRLEGANKPYGTNILVSEATVRGLQGTYRLREVDRIRVKGKHAPVAVFELLDHLPPETLPTVDELRALYDDALAGYRARDWPKAERSFEEALRLVPSDALSRMYRDRCRHFVQHPPPDDWDGVWVMQSK